MSHVPLAFHEDIMIELRSGGETKGNCVNVVVVGEVGASSVRAGCSMFWLEATSLGLVRTVESFAFIPRTMGSGTEVFEGMYFVHVFVCTSYTHFSCA